MLVLYLLLTIKVFETFYNDAFSSIDAHGSQELKTVLDFENDIVYNSAEHSADSANAQEFPIITKNSAPYPADGQHSETCD